MKSVDPTFCSMTNSFFICEFFLKKDLKSPIIFVLFLKGKQNKKENSKCDSLFKKNGLWK